MRQQHLDRFYAIINDLGARIGKQVLRDCDRRMGWPDRGVYFFFEDGEFRADGSTPRVVRVGTHAVTTKSKTRLWTRLNQHQGTKSGGGHHRASIFRLLVGAALLERGDITGPRPGAWEQTKSSGANEEPTERAVSAYIGSMPFLWVETDDAPGPKSDRSTIKKNAIALLSNRTYSSGPADPSSPTWLGHRCPRDAICESGLWNNQYTSRDYDSSFLDILERCAVGTNAL